MEIAEATEWRGQGHRPRVGNLIFQERRNVQGNIPHKSAEQRARLRSRKVVRRAVMLHVVSKNNNLRKGK